MKRKKYEAFLIVFLCLAAMIGMIVWEKYDTYTTPDSEIPSPPGYLAVGERLEISRIKHIRGNYYELGYGKELKWLRIGSTYGDSELHVIDQEDIPVSYLERLPDVRPSKLGKKKSARYALHIAKSARLEAGSEQTTTGSRTTRSEAGQMITP